MPYPRANNRFSFGLIEGKINFHEKHNSVYSNNEILHTLLYLSVRNRYPENGCERIFLNSKGYNIKIKEEKNKVFIDEHEIPWWE